MGLIVFRVPVYCSDTVLTPRIGSYSIALAVTLSVLAKAEVVRRGGGMKGRDGDLEFEFGLPNGWTQGRRNDGTIWGMWGDAVTRGCNVFSGANQCRVPSFDT